jgi:Golgi nucleoside diphosphatase
MQLQVMLCEGIVYENTKCDPVLPVSLEPVNQRKHIYTIKRQTVKIEFSYSYSIGMNIQRHKTVIGYHLIWGCTVIPCNDYSELMKGNNKQLCTFKNRIS